MPLQKVSFLCSFLDKQKGIYPLIAYIYNANGLHLQKTVELRSCKLRRAGVTEPLKNWTLIFHFTP